MFEKLFANLPFFASLLLFILGFYTMLADSNLIKKIIGMNIMDTGIFLFFISLGYNDSGGAANPLPSALIYGGLAATLSLTAFGLALIVRLYKYYGTVDADKIWSQRGEGE